MANFGRVKTWGNETLQAADLNAEFDNVINNVTSGSVSSANIDLTDGYAWTGAHTFSVDMKVLNGAGVIVGNSAQVTTSSAGEFQVLGTAAADSTAIIGHWAAAATGGKVSFVKSRNATIGSSTIVADNDVLGTIEFMADDGSDFATPAASIFARVNGTPGANDMPGELVLAVTADAGNAVTERVRILQNGTVELNSGTLSFDGAASIDTSGNAILGLSAGTADIQVTASNLTPASNDGSALGVSGTAWSDLFLASGSVLNWVAGDITLTHSAGKLTFGGDGAVGIDITSANNLSPIFLVENTHANGNSASIDFYKNSSSVATYDGLGTINFYGKNAAGTPEKTKYAYISAAGAVITDGSESGQLDFVIIKGGSNTSAIRVEPTEVVFNDNQVDMDFRVESDDNANAFFIEGSTSRIGIGTGAPGQILESKTSGQSTWYNSTTGAADAEIQFGVDVDDAANDYYARVGIDYSDGKALKVNASGSLADNHLTVGQGAKGVGIGTSTWGTNAVNVLAIYNGTAPDAVANTAQLYTTSGELYVKDAGGNASLLSPHNFGGRAPSEPMAWAYHSTSAKEQKAITVDMLRVVRVLEQLAGEQLVYIEEIA